MLKDIDVRQVLSLRNGIALNLSSNRCSKMMASTDSHTNKNYKIMEIFHAHIYFKENEIELAKQVREGLILAIPQLIYVGELILKPIGPHPMPMFEIHIPSRNINKAALLIDKKRAGLPVLIHPVQADELAAHTVFARWLGEGLSLNLEAL